MFGDRFVEQIKTLACSLILMQKAAKDIYETLKVVNLPSSKLQSDFCRLISNGLIFNLL